MYRFLSAVLVLIFVANCDGYKSKFKKAITNEYPALYEAVFERDGQKLLEFTDSDNAMVANQAWKAMINTPYNDIDALIERAASANTKDAWAGLWFKDLDERHLEKLHSLWKENPDLRVGMASVLGVHGNKSTLELLFDVELMDMNDELEFEIAYAMGMLTTKYDFDAEQQAEIVNRAVGQSKSETRRAYLYGYYRTGKTFDSAAERQLLDEWRELNRDDVFDPYVFKILMINHAKDVLYHFDLDEFALMNTQFAIEVAKTLEQAPVTDYSTLVLSSLLNHYNHNVIMSALKTIQMHAEYSEELNNVVRSQIAGSGLLPNMVRLEALNTIEEANTLEDMTIDLAGDDPYLLSVKYAILKKYYSEDDYFELLEADIKSNEGLFRVFAVSEFANWWKNLDEAKKTANRVENARNLLLYSMDNADRSMAYSMSDLFMDENLLPASDFYLLADMLERFRLPEDIEVYQSMAGIFNKRFKEESKSLIDSLAGYGNSALNKTLANLGWQVEENESDPVKFRTPDWGKLAKLGPNPIMRLYTDKGLIRIELDVLSAPATISGMQSLAENGEYNNVAFHRVVPNFVIQGGDVQTGDGFGGPDYIVPTESSSKHYNRAITGMASAGADTEGSQYFIMNHWAPHLNGRYTIIGKVLSGMETVDQILVGDKVTRAVIVKS